MYPSGYIGDLTLNDLNFISPSYGGRVINTIKNINERFAALNNLLNIKQTRLNSSTCNIYYHTTLLPPSYPNQIPLILNFRISGPEF